MVSQLTILGIDIRPGDIISRLPGVPVVSGADVDPKYPHSRTLTMADGSIYFCDPQQEYSVTRPTVPGADNLTPAQLDGIACVICAEETGPTVPVGMVDGCQIFAHRRCMEPSPKSPTSRILVLGPCADEDERRDLRMSAFDVTDQLGFPAVIATSLDIDVRAFAAVVLDQDYLSDVTAAVLWAEAAEAGVPIIIPASPRDLPRCDACGEAKYFGVVREEFEHDGRTLAESLCADCDDRTPGCSWCLTSGEPTEPVSDGADVWMPLCAPCAKVQKTRIRRQGGRRSARKVCAVA